MQAIKVKATKVKSKTNRGKIFKSVRATSQYFDISIRKIYRLIYYGTPFTYKDEEYVLSIPNEAYSIEVVKKEEGLVDARRYEISKNTRN